MSIIKMEGLDTVELNRLAQEKWSTDGLPIEVKEVSDIVVEGEELTVDPEIDKNFGSIRVGITVDPLNIRPTEEVADELVEKLREALTRNGEGKAKFFSYPTTESIVSPVMGGFDLGGVQWQTAYYAGNLDINPPDIKAWMVVTGRFE